jgi:hypothetical protein
MRAKIAGLPTPARLMLGLMTVALLAFIGGSFLKSSPWVAYGCFAAAAFRLFVWLGEVRTWLRTPEEEGPE